MSRGAPEVGPTPRGGHGSVSRRVSPTNDDPERRTTYFFPIPSIIAITRSMTSSAPPPIDVSLPSR